jgi:hypothetical protein
MSDVPGGARMIHAEAAKVTENNAAIADLAAFRQNKIDNPKEGDKPPAGYEQVRLIGCIHCQTAVFQLTHDHRVACATCKIIIDPLRWYDVNYPPPPDAVA